MDKILLEILFMICRKTPCFSYGDIRQKSIDILMFLIYNINIPNKGGEMYVYDTDKYHPAFVKTAICCS